MLESIQSFSSIDDNALIEAVREGFYALIEGSLSVELSPVNGKIMPSIYVPTEQDTIEKVGRTGKKSYETIAPGYAAGKISQEAAQQDILKWFYHAVQNKELDEDLIRFVLFNSGSPIATVTGIEDTALPQDIAIDMSTHPLWAAVKDQVSLLLDTDPEFASLKEKFTTNFLEKKKSLYSRNPNNQDLSKIADIVKQREELNRQHSVSLRSAEELARQRAEAGEEASRLSAERSKQKAEENAIKEAERKQKNAAISPSDIMKKVESDAVAPKTFAELMAARNKEDEAKKQKFAAANSLFKS